MDTEDHCLVAEYESLKNANVGLRALETADFTDKTVSIVTRNNADLVTDLSRVDGTAPSSSEIGETAAAAGFAGGSLGAALGSATLIGPFIVAGPLAGTAVGGSAAGVLTAIEKQGITREVTSEIESRVQEGGVFVLVNDDDSRLDKAHGLLETTGPKTLRRFTRTQEQLEN